MPFHPVAQNRPRHQEHALEIYLQGCPPAFQRAQVEWAVAEPASADPRAVEQRVHTAVLFEAGFEATLNLIFEVMIKTRSPDARAVAAAMPVAPVMISTRSLAAMTIWESSSQICPKSALRLTGPEKFADSDCLRTTKCVSIAG
jgi:hypothetical protein